MSLWDNNDYQRNIPNVECDEVMNDQEYQEMIEKYQFVELVEALQRIDKEIYPQRYEMLVAEIEKRKKNEGVTEDAMAHGVESIEMAELPVVQILYEAVDLCKQRYFYLLKFALPLIVVGGVALIISSVALDSEQVGPFIVSGGLVIALLFLLALVLAVIGCHRTFLMSHEEAVQTPVLRWSGREMRFVGWWILVALCLLLISIPLSLITGLIISFQMSSAVAYTLVTLFVSLPVYYLFSRWALLFPATAIDKRDLSFSWAWNLSHGNGWRLTLLVALLPVMTNILFELLPFYDSIIYFVFQGVLWLIVGAFEIALLSLSYSYLSGARIKSS